MISNDYNVYRKWRINEMIMCQKCNINVNNGVILIMYNVVI